MADKFNELNKTQEDLKDINQNLKESAKNLHNIVLNQKVITKALDIINTSIKEWKDSLKKSRIKNR